MCLQTSFETNMTQVQEDSEEQGESRVTLKKRRSPQLEGGGLGLDWSAGREEPSSCEALLGRESGLHGVT